MSALVALGGTVVSAPVLAQTLPKTRYWTGSSGGFRYRWTTRDLAATDAATNHPVYSVVAALKHEMKSDAADIGEVSPEDHYEVSFFPLSVVGSLLSYERDDYWEGGAHPSGNESFVTVDVRHPTRAVRVNELFPAAQIRQSLLSDPIVRRVLAREKITPPATLDGLVKALASKEFGGEDDDMYQFPANLLETFAFHHVENGKIAVRFLLPHGTEIYRFRNTQIGILLPIPARLRSAFTQASTGKSGALMQTLRKTTADRKSSLTLLE